MPVKLIADSGSTKCAWALTGKAGTHTFTTSGLNPWFLDKVGLTNVLEKELKKHLPKTIHEIYFYGTGLGHLANKKMLKALLTHFFPAAKTEVQTDILAAARAVCNKEKGLAAILGTGASVCFYNGQKITKNKPGLGYVLGDEGSGAYLGKKVLQAYLYDMLDADLREKFQAQFETNKTTILEHVYTMPLPNKYMASFTAFLAANRGHYMVENILEDGFRDFFSTHIASFKESDKYPVGFVGSIAFGFKDILENLCLEYHFKPGKILRDPLEGLIAFHNKGK